MYVLLIVVCPFVLFLLAIVLSVLRILIAPLVSSSSSDLDIFSFGLCTVCPSLITLLVPAHISYYLVDSVEFIVGIAATTIFFLSFVFI